MLKGVLFAGCGVLLRITVPKVLTVWPDAKNHVPRLRADDPNEIQMRKKESHWL